MLLDDTKKALADNLTDLLHKYPAVSRLDLSRKMKVADGTLGRIKYGTGNPQLENLCHIAEFFKIKPWQLLVPLGYKLPKDFDPFSVPAPEIPAGHVRIPVHEAFSSIGASGDPVDHPAVLGHIDVTEGWAREHLGQRIEQIRALPVIGDSMSPTINEGDLAFVDVAVKRFETDAIYVIVWQDRLLIKRLTINLAQNCLEVSSDNRVNPTQQIPPSEIDTLNVRGRIKAWLAVRAY